MLDERLKAIQTLIRYGVLKRVKDMKLQHARSNEGTEFVINPNYKSEKRIINAYNKPMIYAFNDEEERAIEYAKMRASQRGGTPEVIDITSYNEDAFIFDTSVYDKLHNGGKILCLKALETLLNQNQTHYMRVDYQDKQRYLDCLALIDDFVKTIRDENNYLKQNLYEEKVIAKFIEYAKSKRIDEKAIDYCVTIMHSRNQLYAITHHMFDQIIRVHFNDGTGLAKKSSIFIKNDSGKSTFFPLGEFGVIDAFYQDNNIIGCKIPIGSDSADDVEAVTLFDFHKFNTRAQVEKTISALEAYYSPIAECFSEFGDEETQDILTKNPKDIMKYVCEKNPKLKQVYQSSAQVWEGYTIGEHTLSTMQLFDDSYDLASDINPVLKSIVYVVLLSHDLGKYKPYQKVRETTITHMQQLCETLNLTKRDFELVKCLALDSQKYTSDYYVRGNVDALQDLREYCSSLLFSYLGRKATEQEIKGLCGICRMIQTCDSAAYTSFARSSKVDEDLEFVNMSSFDDSFIVEGKRVKFKIDSSFGLFEEGLIV
ncbi:MAG: hypothetical protein E7374_00175 [Clostridiales bacterium]|nr:hypothetical protein [Clostridiales bacterium]